MNHIERLDTLRKLIADQRKQGLCEFSDYHATWPCSKKAKHDTDTGNKLCIHHRRMLANSGPGQFTWLGRCEPEKTKTTDKTVRAKSGRRRRSTRK